MSKDASQIKNLLIDKIPTPEAALTFEPADHAVAGVLLFIWDVMREVMGMVKGVLRLD
ncbi:MAG: hypothetical protein LBR53_12690 [Deltaproteobacteria bacterium]|nr:hypothetical protein [Deltaproteobacteria bacterium]